MDDVGGAEDALDGALLDVKLEVAEAFAPIRFI